MTNQDQDNSSSSILASRQIGCVRVIHGNSLDVLPTLERSVSAVLTDPPYGLEFMNACWDRGVPGKPFWTKIRSCCLPGAYLLAFGGTRTYHRQTCAIEDAGWTIRDCLMWIYGSGFPKSLDISKAIDKSLGAEREVIGEYQVSRDISKGSWQDLHCKPNNATMVNITKPATPQSKLWDGYGTAIKPAYEPVVLAMNPREGSFVNNALEHGCGGLNIDETRIGTGGEVLSCSKSAPFHAADGFQRTWNPTTGCGIDRVQHPVGRWPANILINDSPEVVGLFPDTNATKTQRNDNRQNRNNSMFIDGIHGPDNSYNDKGSAARFFYCAKAGRNEREIGCEEIDPIDRSIATGRKEGSAGLDNPRAMQRSTRPIRNNHPTVKPVQLMRYLLRLVTQPQHNMVLDPFGGSGTTGVACALDGIPAIVVELDKRHWEICCARIQWAVDLRRRLGRSPELDLSPYVQPSKLENGNGQGELF